jgi:hypothetical protein
MYCDLIICIKFAISYACIMYIHQCDAINYYIKVSGLQYSGPTISRD